jgi:hypothetical protein
MFENVPFFKHMHLKFAKSVIMTQKIFFTKISMKYQKPQNFFAMGSKKCIEKIYRKKSAKSEKLKICTALCL